MDLGLKGEHVLITGGSQGIGFACAQAFVAQGARVTLVARNTATLAKARDQLITAGASADQVHTESADLRDATAALHALDQAEAHFGPVQVLVNSAGAAQRVPVDELTPPGLARRHAGQIFQLRAHDRPVHQAHGPTRQRQHRQHHWQWR